MTRTTRAEARSRLREAITHELGPDTMDAHKAAIESALADLPVPSAPAPLHMVRTRRWAVALATVAASLSPVGVAVAAEQSLPGDSLYPAKLATESIRSVIDPLVSARHRLSELEALIELEADSSIIQAALAAARNSVSELDPDHPLVTRLEALDQVVTAGDGLPGPSDDGPAPSSGQDDREGEDQGDTEPEDDDDISGNEDPEETTDDDSPSTPDDDDVSGAGSADDDTSQEEE